MYPADYGGAIDVFYRIKALHDAGVRVILHCTYKGQLNRYAELESLCEQVYYYSRNMSVFNQFSRLPYAVLTRKDSRLLENLAKDDYPILFEGLVTCFFINHPVLAGRTKYFRECNVEHDYYRQLASATKSLYRKIYYTIEARKLQRFESVVRSADIIYALSHGDELHFKTAFPDNKVVYMPCFHANSEVTSLEGKSSYILYHGNLGLAENIKAAMYICCEVLPLMPDVHFVFAGRQPDKQLVDKLSETPNTELVANPNEKQMADLVQNAHIHLLVTHQATGMKLKLLNVLYQGRFVVANSAMVEGTEMKDLCYIADTPQQQADLCRRLMSESFSVQHIVRRKDILNRYFSNNTLVRNFVKPLMP